MLSTVLICVSCLNILSASQAPAEKMLFQFGKQFDLASVETKDATPSISGGALRIATGQKERSPGITLKAPGGAWDLSAFGYVALAVKNVGSNPVKVQCRVGSTGANGTSSSISGAVDLSPGQQDRAQSYKRYVLGAIKNPLIVGAHWFQFGDQPFTGRFDGENFQIGFVDVCDTPNPEIIQACREVAAKLYALCTSQ